MQEQLFLVSQVNSTLMLQLCSPQSIAFKQKRYMEKEEIKFQEATDKAIADFEGALK